MHIRFDMHRAAICTAANKKLRIPLTKNEQSQRVRVALLKLTRCNSSHERFQHVKTWRKQSVSWCDAENRMAQGFFAVGTTDDARTQSGGVASKIRSQAHVRASPARRIRATKIFFNRHTQRGRQTTKSIRTRANRRQLIRARVHCGARPAPRSHDFAAIEAW